MTSPSAPESCSLLYPSSCLIPKIGCDEWSLPPCTYLNLADSWLSSLDASTSNPPRQPRKPVSQLQYHLDPDQVVTLRSQYLTIAAVASKVDTSINCPEINMSESSAIPAKVQWIRCGLWGPPSLTGTADIGFVSADAKPASSKGEEETIANEDAHQHDSDSVVHNSLIDDNLMSPLPDESTVQPEFQNNTRLDVLRDMMGVLSENVDVKSEKINTLSEKIDVLSEKETFLAKKMHVLRNMMGVLSENMNVRSEEIKTLSKKIKTQSEKMDVLSEKETVMAKRVEALCKMRDTMSQRKIYVSRTVRCEYG